MFSILYDIIPLFAHSVNDFKYSYLRTTDNVRPSSTFNIK